jgi:hypothetical protein
MLDGFDGGGELCPISRARVKALFISKSISIIFCIIADGYSHAAKIDSGIFLVYFLYYGICMGSK